MHVAARGKHSARAANDLHAYCGAGRTFRARVQRSASVLRRGAYIPHARPTIRSRIAAQGEHSARATNDPHAYCGAGRTFRARGQRPARVLRRAENIPRARPTIHMRIAAWGEHSARAANDPHAHGGAGRTFRTRGIRSSRVLRYPSPVGGLPGFPPRRRVFPSSEGENRGKPGKPSGARFSRFSPTPD